MAIRPIILQMLVMNSHPLFKRSLPKYLHGLLARLLVRNGGDSGSMHLVEGGNRRVERFDQIFLVDVAAHEVELLCDVLFDYPCLCQDSVLCWIK